MSPLPDPVADAPAYTRAVLERLGDRDPLAVQRRLDTDLRQAVAGVSDADLRRPERDGKWSILEVVLHLADSEIVYGYRYRAILAAAEPALPGYDQDAWARALHYSEADLEPALADLAAARSANLRLLERLTPAEMARIGHHGERGPESLDLMVRLLAGHDLLHLVQIERIRNALGI